MNKQFNTIFLILSILVFIIGALLRMEVLLRPKQVFLVSDEAVFALIAKHIMELKEFPIYMWRAHYGGTLVSYFSAIFFLIFGISSYSFKIAGVVFSLVWVLLMFGLGKKIYNRDIGLLTAVFISIPSYFVLSFSRYTVGVYAEGLVFTTLIILFLFNCLSDIETSFKNFLLLGLFSGIGLWLSPFIIPVLLTVITMFLIKYSKKLLLIKSSYFLQGFIFGYLPAIIYNLQFPKVTLYRMAGRILDLDRSLFLLSNNEILRIVIIKIIYRISEIPNMLMNIPTLLFHVIGIENIYTKNIFLLIIAMLILMFYIAMVVYTIISNRSFFTNLKLKNLTGSEILIVYIFWFVVFYCMFVEPDRPRYLLPLVIPFTIFLAKFLNDIRKIFQPIFWSILILIFSFNLSTHSDMLKIPSKKYNKLAEFLLTQNIYYCYSDYWVAYPIIFESRERVIVSPTLFNAVYDRRPEYTEDVRESKDPAYIFDIKMYKNLTGEFERKVAKLGIYYKKYYIDDFIVYYNFSRKIYPENLNLMDSLTH